MGQKVDCQPTTFLFSSACGECDRCHKEAAVVLNRWGTTPLYQVPPHIIECLMRSMEILGPEKGVQAIRGGL